MKRTVALTLGLVMVAGAALASNTGFKLNYGLQFNPVTERKSNNNWIAFPYFYFPNGNVGVTPQNAIDACFDMNGAAGSSAKVTTIYRFDTTSDTAKQKFCSSTAIKGFDLKAGEGYSVLPAAAGIVIDIVGSHDDAHAPNKNGGTALSFYTLRLNPVSERKSNNNWFSVPYHVMADNAIDLCTKINGTPGSSSVVNTVYRFDTTSDTAKQKFCTSTAIKGFDLKPGEGYSLLPSVDGAKIALDVY